VRGYSVINLACSDKARTKVYAHRMVELCKELEKETSGLDWWTIRKAADVDTLRDFIKKINLRSIQSHVKNIKDLALSMSRDNFL